MLETFIAVYVAALLGTLSAVFVMAGFYATRVEEKEIVIPQRCSDEELNEIVSNAVPSSVFRADQVLPLIFDLQDCRSALRRVETEE